MKKAFHYLLCGLLSLAVVGMADAAGKRKKSDMGNYDGPKPMTNKEVREFEKEMKRGNREKKKTMELCKKIAKSVGKGKIVSAPDVNVADDEVDTLTKAAEQGDASAMIRLGHYYMMRPTPGWSNEVTAREWFQKAADTGDWDGVVWIAVLDFFKQYNSQYQESKHNLYNACMPAAEAGNMLGMFLVGLASGGSEDPAKVEESLEWMRKSAAKGFAPAMYVLADRLFFITQKVTPEITSICESAIKGGCYKAYEVLANDGSIQVGGEPRKLNRKKLIGYAEKHLQAARAQTWTWYGTLFNSRVATGDAYTWGGVTSYEMLTGYYVLFNVTHRTSPERSIGSYTSTSDADAVLDRQLKELERDAKAGDVNAMAAMICLGQNWKFWTNYHGDTPPFNPGDYRAILQQAAGDDTHLLHILNHGCIQK